MVTIRIHSFNVATKVPNKKDQETLELQEWLSTQNSPDILVFSFQELVHQVKALLLSPVECIKFPKESESVQGLSVWYDYIKGFCPEYKTIALGRSVAIGIIVLAKKDLEITNVSIGSIWTGLLGVYGNKGAVSVALTLQQQSFCFIACHLAAHQGSFYYHWRNEEMKVILNSLFLDSWKVPVDYDVVFVCGDLNYRLTKRDTEALQKQDIKALVALDELQAPRKGSWGLFQEGQINFLPTYKLDRGSYSKKRIPSYCDRVLYYPAVECKEYKAHFKCTWSDHAPIHGEYNVLEMPKSTRQTSLTQAITLRVSRLLKIHSILIFVILIGWILLQ